MSGNGLWWVALVAAFISGPLSGYIAHHLTTKRLLRENALMQSRQEHEVVFQGIYTRQADTISELYSLIVDLADAFNLRKFHKDMVEVVERQLSNSNPEMREDLEEKKQEYDVNARYEEYKQKGHALVTFYERKNIWFIESGSTVSSLNKLVSIQRKISEAQSWKPILEGLDSLGVGMDKAILAADRSIKAAMAQMEELDRASAERGAHPTPRALCGATK